MKRPIFFQKNPTKYLPHDTVCDLPREPSTNWIAVDLGLKKRSRSLGGLDDHLVLCISVIKAVFFPLNYCWRFFFVVFSFSGSVSSSSGLLITKQTANVLEWGGIARRGRICWMYYSLWNAQVSWWENELEFRFWEWCCYWGVSSPIPPPGKKSMILSCLCGFAFYDCCLL